MEARQRTWPFVLPDARRKPPSRAAREGNTSFQACSTETAERVPKTIWDLRRLVSVDVSMQTPSAALVIQISGGDLGQVSVLDVQGNANLNGSLDPVLVNGFVPDVGQSFAFLGYASVNGGFSHITNSVFDHGRIRWLVVYTPTGAVLSVVAKVTPRPRPTPAPHP